jgi:hypothetical protein
VPGVSGEDAGGDTGTKKGRGSLTDEQLQQLRDRMEQRRKDRAGQAGKQGAALDPQKASAAAIGEAFKAGEAAFKAENYPVAFEFFVDVAACAQVQGAANFVDQARGRLLEMERMAADKLDEAKLKKLQADGPGALGIVRLLLEKFYFTRSADEGRNLMMGLAADPRVAAAVAMLAAEDLDSAGKYYDAAARYQALMKKYPDSVQALKAKLRLEAMSKDEAIAAALKEGAGKAAEVECPKLLAAARNFLANGLPDRARPLFQKVVEGYPETEYAKEAKQALDELNAVKKEAPQEPAK